MELPLPSRSRGGAYTTGCIRLRARKGDVHLAVPRNAAANALDECEIIVAADADDDEDTESLWRLIERNGGSKASVDTLDPEAAARAEMAALGLGTSPRPMPVSQPKTFSNPARTDSASLYQSAVRQPSSRTSGSSLINA
eukprot:SAG31_NODE_2895_length_4940_cov_4.688494_5_plen_140_part_00